MAFNIYSNGDIELVQGDSGSIVIDGISTDKNYTVCLAIQDNKRRPIGNEISVYSNNQSSVIFTLTSDFTDLLTVHKNNLYENYYYGIKICFPDDNFEETLIVKGNDIGDVNLITVYPKKVEGVNG